MDTLLYPFKRSGDCKEPLPSIAHALDLDLVLLVHNSDEDNAFPPLKQGCRLPLPLSNSHFIATSYISDTKTPPQFTCSAQAPLPPHPRSTRSPSEQSCDEDVDPQLDSAIILSSLADSHFPPKCSFEEVKAPANNHKKKIKPATTAAASLPPFSCPDADCGRIFASASNLRVHKRMHTGEKPFACPFNSCGKCFVDSGSLTKHRRVHTGEKPFICQQCGHAFAQSGHLRRHQRIHVKDV
jgi:uncharacterized Zn-finger protein